MLYIALRFGSTSIICYTLRYVLDVLQLSVIQCATFWKYLNYLLYIALRFGRSSIICYTVRYVLEVPQLYVIHCATFWTFFNYLLHYVHEVPQH